MKERLRYGSVSYTHLDVYKRQVLTMTGYVPNVAQSAQTMGAFHFVVSFLPGIVMMIGAIPMFFYSLTEERHAQIMEELKERRAQKERDK